MRAIGKLIGSFALVLLAAAQGSAQAHRAFPFRATNYNVEVIVHPENQTIDAEVKADFVASQVSRTLLVELHPDLQITAVKSAAGKTLTFGRDNNEPLLVSVGLDETATAGKTVSLTFDYEGPLHSLDDSPTPGVRFGSINKTSGFMLLPARWFPLTNYPSNRYTGTFKLIVPDTFVVVGTGKADPPQSMPALPGSKSGAQLSYLFHCDEAGPVGSFVMGPLQLTNAPVEGYQISVYTPQAQAATAQPYAQSAGRIMSFYSDSFGPLPAGAQLTIAQMPDGSLQGYSAPGLLLLSAGSWSTAKPNEGLLAQLAAGQWWGDRVLPASSGDVWVTDGLARYGQAMYAEQSDGVAGLHNALQEFAVGALMYEGVTPVASVQSLGAYSDQYRSIVEDKGAMVFHMLRTELGDDAFNSMLHDFYQQHAGKTASIDELEQLANAHVPPATPDKPPVNLLSFFSQWLNSTGVPEFSVDYIEYRTPQGFQVIGKIKQDLDTFRMPVDVRVTTDGNPVTKATLVTGTSSDFEVDTYGMPKPNGVSIDPDNNLLKSSPHLRVLALVARGEALAQVGKYYEAIQEYQRALDVQPTNSLAHFRMAEAMFYQKNYNSAANEFRSAIGGDLDPKWVEVWSHIYMGKIYDLLGQRERAVNEYSNAQHMKDDTAGAQEEAQLYLQKPYNPNQATPASNSPAPAPAATSPAGDAPSGEPTLKRRTD
ncbi:MAG TPA: tetratricopeptide repeat protein [Candidatus Acidoferrum sp.]|nr:tetratricopeptide repeat protein [Candidatus Acidoferrum sp.]